MKFRRYLITAMGLGLAGGAIYVIIQASPGERTSEYFSAAVLLLFAFLMFKVFLPTAEDVDHSDLLRDGEPAMATVVAVRDTGTRFSDRPVFEFTLDVARADGEPRRLTTRHLMDVVALTTEFPSGTIVPVRVDPDKPAEVAIDWGRADDAGAEFPPAATSAPEAAGVPPAAEAAGAVPPVDETLDSDDAVRGGVGAQATIQMVSPTGLTFGQMRPSDASESTSDDPMVLLALVVEGPSGATFTAQGIHRVPHDRLPELRPGGAVPVAYLPNDPVGTACVDWDRL